MARKDVAEQMLRNGMYVSQIAQHMEISAKSVTQYLRTRVGEGALRLSELYFSWPPEIRRILQEAGGGDYPNDRLLEANDLCRDDLDLFQSLRNATVFRGDLYEYLSDTEIAIHRFVQDRLESEYGPNQEDWWRGGIPENIRKECVSRREEDDEPSDSAYAYTTLINLSTVISKNWSLFKNEVPEHYQGNQKKQLEGDLVRLNRIRNAVMHPVKERKWTEEDFEFVRRIFNLFGSLVSK